MPNTTTPETVPSDRPCVSIDESQNTTRIMPSRPASSLRVTEDAHPVTIPSQAQIPTTVDTSEHTPSLRVPVEHTETEPPNTTYANSTKPKTAKQRLAQRHFKNHQRITTMTPTTDGQCNRAIDAHRLLTAIQHMALHGNAFTPDTGKLAEYHELSQCSDGPLWVNANGDEIGRLCQGRGTRVKGTDTMFFIRYQDVPKHKKVTYVNIVVAHRPEKVDPYDWRCFCC
jgi:hypothetical protein